MAPLGFGRWPQASLPLAVLAGSALLAPAAVAPVFAAGPEVRVLLLERASVPLQALDRPLRLRDGRSGPPLATLAPGEQASLRLERGQLQLELGGVTRRLPAVSALWLEATAPASGDSSADFGLEQRRYRGRLELRPQGGALQGINHVALESYLPSVVGSEMPASWPQAALRAQAVAARTYALRQRRPGAPFDVSATVSSQVYKGVGAETASTREAVAATRGQVLTYAGQLANTVFHSSAGGRTENSGELWSQQLPYLVSVPDFDQQSPVAQWQQRLEPEQLLKAFAETGGVDRIEVLATTSSGRVRQARVQGPRGSLVLTGAQLRSRLGLRSTQVRFEPLAAEIASAALPVLPPPPPPVPVLEGQPPLQLPRPAWLAIGRGFGHGVGMSQWGAHAMALKGKSYQQILSYYYRGTRLSLDGVR